LGYLGITCGEGGLVCLCAGGVRWGGVGWGGVGWFHLGKSPGVKMYGRWPAGEALLPVWYYEGPNKTLLYVT